MANIGQLDNERIEMQSCAAAWLFPLAITVWGCGGCEKSATTDESTPRVPKSLHSPEPSVLDGLSASDVTSVKIEIFDYEAGKRQAKTTNSEDRAAIDALVASFSPRTAVEPHKCASAGVITLFDGEKERSFQILPGHSEEYYEMRGAGGNYRFPRQPFLDALASMGIRDVPKID